MIVDDETTIVDVPPVPRGGRVAAFVDDARATLETVWRCAGQVVIRMRTGPAAELVIGEMISALRWRGVSVEYVEERAHLVIRALRHDIDRARWGHEVLRIEVAP